jgi:hypothetical protein
MSQPLPATLRDLTAAALTLARLLNEADDVQWQRSIVPQPRDDTSERARGGHSDPTADIVADERRLALRAQVVAGQILLESATRAMLAVSRRLERALEKWNGG